MTATNTTQVTIGSTMLELAKGDQITVTTTSGTKLDGEFVSLTPRGLRFRHQGAYVTRKMSVVADVELLGGDDNQAEPPAELAAPAGGEATTFTDEGPAADGPADDDAPLHFPAEWVEEHASAPATPAATPAPVVAAPAAEATTEDVDYGDPIINGKLLSTMRFAEVMELAKKYKTPGRGVARIDALRAGVAKAIALEVSSRI